MGSGIYDSYSRGIRATKSGYYVKSANEIFSSKSINNAMNPHGIKIRESRDSEEHPNSLPIILALDVTGSMGSIPHHLVKDGLPTIISKIQEKGIKDPQMLFLGIGDHECDNSPLQVGQFETSDELIDKWLTTIYLEGGGGGNAGESYLLAWYFAGYHTVIDSFEKRKQKGFLFTIGDEPTLKEIPKNILKNLMGDGQYEDYTDYKLLEHTSKLYNVFHIHIKETQAGSRKNTIDGWKQLMQDNLIVSERHEEIPNLIANKIIEIMNVEKKELFNFDIKKEESKPLTNLL